MLIVSLKICIKKTVSATQAFKTIPNVRNHQWLSCHLSIEMGCSSCSINIIKLEHDHQHQKRTHCGLLLMVQMNGLRLMPIANIAELIDLKWIARCFSFFSLAWVETRCSIKTERTNPKQFLFKSEIAMSQIWWNNQWKQQNKSVGFQVAKLDNSQLQTLGASRHSSTSLRRCQSAEE